MNYYYGIIDHHDLRNIIMIMIIVIIVIIMIIILHMRAGRVPSPLDHMQATILSSVTNSLFPFPLVSALCTAFPHSS